MTFSSLSLIYAVLMILVCIFAYFKNSMVFICRPHTPIQNTGILSFPQALKLPIILLSEFSSIW